MRLVLALALVLIALLAVFSYAGSPPALADTTVVPIEAVPTPGGGDSIQCGFCSQGQCGCSQPPTGCTLIFECTCSIIQCTRDCKYVC